MMEMPMRESWDGNINESAGKDRVFSHLICV